MRTKPVRFLIVVTALLLFVAVAAGAYDRRCSRDAAGYDVLVERTFEGTIAGKGRTHEGLVYLPLRTNDVLLEIQIGPKDFLTSRNVKLKPGDRVTVIGVPVVLQQRNVVLAREIVTRSGVLVLRDHDGAPLWDGNRPIRMDPERRTNFETCETFK